jgi:hypothetical protein
VNVFLILSVKVLTAVGTRCADHVTPLYPQKLALTSPTGGGRSVGIVRSPTKDTEFSLVLVGEGRLERSFLCRVQAGLGVQDNHRRIYRPDGI